MPHPSHPWPARNPHDLGDLSTALYWACLLPVPRPIPLPNAHVSAVDALPTPRGQCGQATADVVVVVPYPRENMAQGDAGGEQEGEQVHRLWWEGGQ